MTTQLVKGQVSPEAHHLWLPGQGSRRQRLGSKSKGVGAPWWAGHQDKSAGRGTLAALFCCQYC